MLRNTNMDYVFFLAFKNSCNKYGYNFNNDSKKTALGLLKIS